MIWYSWCLLFWPACNKVFLFCVDFIVPFFFLLILSVACLSHSLLLIIISFHRCPGLLFKLSGWLLLLSSVPVYSLRNVLGSSVQSFIHDLHAVTSTVPSYIGHMAAPKKYGAETNPRYVVLLELLLFYYNRVVHWELTSNSRYILSWRCSSWPDK